jgi:hypothetical protein
MHQAMLSFSDLADGCYLGVEQEPDGPVGFYKGLGFAEFDTAHTFHLRPS